MGKDIIDLVTEHEGTIFVNNYSAIDNEGYLQYRLRYLLSRYEDIKKENRCTEKHQENTYR